jgi:hypothetical protein
MNKQDKYKTLEEIIPQIMNKLKNIKVGHDEISGISDQCFDLKY